MKTSVLSRLPNDRDLTRLIKRVSLLLVVVAIGFTAFYLYDRWRPSPAPIVDQQLATLENAVRSNPDDIASRGGLADLYFEKGRYQDAITQYNAILQTSQFTERATFGRAASYLALGNLDAATIDYQRVVEIAKTGEMANVDPTLQASYYALGDIALRQNRIQDAISFLEKSLKINRADADAMYLLAKAYTAAEQPDKAITLLRAAVVFVPVGWPEPYTALADAYDRSGKTELAQWARAMADFAAGRTEAAESALKTQIAGSASLDAMIGLGLLNEKAGRLNEASAWYKKALEVDSTNTAATMGLGRVLPPSSLAPSPTAQGTAK